MFVRTDCAALITCDYLCSSESLLGRSHELQNQDTRTLPDPLLCARSDWAPEQRVCGPVHPALHQPKERWATPTQKSARGRVYVCVGGGVIETQVINDIRGHGVIVFSVSTLSALLKVVSAPSYLCGAHTFGSYGSVCVLPQDTAGYPFAHETDAAWIQPPSSSWFGIPKNSPFLKNLPRICANPKRTGAGMLQIDKQTRKPHV